MMRVPRPSPWLFARRLDLWLFGAPAIIALALVGLFPLFQAHDWAASHATWLIAVVLVDVGHVWSTWFVTYGDARERTKRKFLLAIAPIASYAVGVALYSASALTFWTALAYVAVFHFIRQQYGWVMLCRARAHEYGRLSRWLDGAVIYASTLWPLAYWHSHLPREFSWFIAGDFRAGLPAFVERVLFAVYLALLSIYIARALMQFIRGQFVPWTKHLIVASTAACWQVGIVFTNSDFAFTITNVLIHGVPYVGLIWLVMERPSAQTRPPVSAIVFRSVWAFLFVLAAIAFTEEFLWDSLVWHERPWLFGTGLDAFDWQAWLVPLLALPQVVHYIVDGFIWRGQRSIARRYSSATRTPHSTA